ncbi:MAG: HDOD domain-containing protein [Acidobacteria bacterium]|nr:MAG: HDOD domain-containing protein [Acidobacteriota bacterium]
MSLRVLFVDDEQMVLDGLRRMLRSRRREWEMHFACGPEQALKLLDEHEFDVVVADMRMPGMDGAELLTRVRTLQPRAVRIILSGHADVDLILRSVGASHQYLTKPCDADLLQRTIARASALKELLDNDSLRETMGRLEAIPSVPELFQELVGRLESPDASMKEIGRLISRDTGMTAQLLRIVNSSYFGVCRQISDPERAAVFLGLSTLSSLVLGTKLFEQIDPEIVERSGLAPLWPHSVAVACGARRIVETRSAGTKMAEDAFAAGMVHDAGILVLARNMPDEYARVVARARAEDRPLHELEREMLGVDHQAVGAYVMNLWGLPSPVVEAVAFHHAPGASGDTVFSALTAVHVADALDIGEGPRAEQLPPAPLDEEYLTAIGLQDELATIRSMIEKACPELAGAR